MSLLQGLTFLLGIGSAYASLINTDTQSFTNSSILGPRRLPIIYETYTPPHRSGDDFVITDKRSKNWALRTIDTAHSQAKNLVFRYHPRLGVPVTFAHGMKLKFDVEYTGDLNVGSKQDNVDWYAWVNTTSLKEAWRETKDMGGTKKWNETAPPQLVYVVKGEANGVSGWNIFEKMRYGNDGHWPGRVPASGKEPNGQEKIATPIITGPGGYERGQFYSCTERLNGKLTPGVLRFGWSHGEGMLLFLVCLCLLPLGCCLQMSQRRSSRPCCHKPHSSLLLQRVLPRHKLIC